MSFFPDVPAAEYHIAAFVGRVNRGIALCYCLGLLPLFPYDVYAGNETDGSLKARWFGTWEEYRMSYETVRAHADWFDDYAWTSCEMAGNGAVTVTSRHAQEPARRLTHCLGAEGTWETAPSKGSG